MRRRRATGPQGKALFFGAGAFGLALVLAACGSDRADTPRDRSREARPVELILTEAGRPDPSVLAEQQVLHRGNGVEPQTLDPHLAEGVPAGNILRDLYEGLVSEAPDGRIVPGVAMRWNISRDGKTYTFYLRRDARWSNGDPLLAGDFVWSFRRSASPLTASKFAEMLMPIENAPAVLAGQAATDSLAVTALDDYTLQISLSAPTPYFLALLTHPATYPVHRPSVEAHGDRFSRPGNLVSNGAFVLSDWVVRSRIALERNERYWDAANTILERVVYYPLEDQSGALKKFRSGDLDWTYEVPNNQFQWLQKNYADALVVSPWLGSYFFGFNLLREPFTESPMLRKALVLAVDRELITEKVTQFGEEPSFTLVPPGIGDYQSPQPDYAAWTQAERFAEARRLYAAAGFTAEDPLRLEIRYNTSENHKKIALAIASIWKQELGVEVTMINEEWKVFLQNRAQRVLTQVFRAGWIGDYADPFSFLQIFGSEHGQNDFGFSNSLYDSLLAEISEERIPARRRRLMEQAERILLEEFPIIPVYTYVTKRLVDPHLRGWESNVMDHHYSKHMYLLASRAPADPIATPDSTPEADSKPAPEPAPESAGPSTPPTVPAATP